MSRLIEAFNELRNDLFDRGRRAAAGAMTGAMI